MIDERVTHGQSGRPQKVSLIGIATRAAHAQIGLVRELGRLQGHCPEAVALPPGNALDLPIEGRKELRGRTPHVR